MASQGDLLMQRKRRHNGEAADHEETTRKYPLEANAVRMPARKSLAESSHFIDSLKKMASSHSRPSVCLTSPTDGSMSSGGLAAVPRKPDPVVVSREQRQREIIEERKIQEDEVRALNDSYRADYHAMLREKERTRLRQRTQAREQLEERTLPALCGSARTVAAAQREALKVMPQAVFVETNRDRVEVNLIRRAEERALLEKRQLERRDLELAAGTSYALTQSKLSTIAKTSSLITTPEQAHEVRLAEEEEAWRQNEEEKDIRRAMDELDALDAKLREEEAQRKEERLAKKKELRDASIRK